MAQLKFTNFIIFRKYLKYDKNSHAFIESSLNMYAGDNNGGLIDYFVIRNPTNGTKFLT